MEVNVDVVMGDIFFSFSKGVRGKGPNCCSFSLYVSENCRVATARERIILIYVCLTLFFSFFISILRFLEDQNRKAFLEEDFDTSVKVTKGRRVPKGW